MSKITFLSLAAVALLVAGCGKNESGAAGTGASSQGAATSSGGVVVLKLTANDQMKYSATRLEAPAGATVRIVLENLGSSPKAIMGHNLILLKQGVDVNEFATAAAAAGLPEYFPAARAGDVLAHIPLMGPKEKKEVTFTAPTAPGEYTFFCSFPAHMLSGMKGVLVVK